MKIKFSCNECSESFNVSSENLIKKDSIVCPNCSSEFPKDSFTELKEGIKLIHNCKKSLPQQEVNCDYCTLIDFQIID